MNNELSGIPTLGEVKHDDGRFTWSLPLDPNTEAGVFFKGDVICKYDIEKFLATYGLDLNNQWIVVNVKAKGYGLVPKADTGNCNVYMHITTEAINYRKLASVHLNSEV
ncbi:MAG: hypothetical protein H7321_09250 [Bacteroidia bacterium]|nr:hypothetical protein [Bacteroidia bacterium]